METIYKKRASRRLPYKIEIEIIGNSGKYFKGNIINISQNGMCISSDSDIPSDIPVDTQILARFFIGSEIYELEGKIEWSSKNPKSGSIKMGVELAKLPDNFNKIYQKIIKRFDIPENDKPSLLDKSLVHKV